MRRRRRIDHAIDNLERYPIKKFTASTSWSRDAFAAIRLIIGVVSLAHQVLALFGKKLIVDPIHRHRYVTAAIYVRVKLTSVIDDKTFFIGTSHREQEFF